MVQLWKVKKSVELYGIDRWGAGYFDVNEEGNLVVKPNQTAEHGADLKKIVDQLVAEGDRLPIVLRFPQILEDRVKILNECFRQAIKEAEYGASYKGVFPVKVNQNKDVVQRLLTIGEDYDYGIEVGSKPELAAAMGLKFKHDALFICNGYKDDDFITSALYASAIGRTVVIVVDAVQEVFRIISLSKKYKIKPLIGIRCKLYSRGSGKWVSSGGEVGKFGLTSGQILDCIETLRENDLLEQLKMLHFHIGSQITEIRRVRKAVIEAARVYSKVKQTGIDIRYLNVGGGLGVDYDGSRTPSDSSVNYSIQEYANTVVYTIKDICNEEAVDVPNIVTESGRAVAAYHSLMVSNVRGKISMDYEVDEVDPGEDSPKVVRDLYEVWRDLTAKNYVESFHYALEMKNDMVSLFNLGHLSLRDKAVAERYFWASCKKALKFARVHKDTLEDFDELSKQMAHKYVFNFSVFQSFADYWAIGQLFPIIPIHRLDERPTEYATLVDITCDSDGKVDKFIDIWDVKDKIELHKLRENDPYYLAVCMLGAYQDTIGDYHNLFGAEREAHVEIYDDGSWDIIKKIDGDDIANVLGYASYDKRGLVNNMTRSIKEAVDANKVTNAMGKRILSRYKKDLESYTYLKQN